MTTLGTILILIGAALIIIALVVLLKKGISKEEREDPTYNERVIKYAEIHVRLAFSSGMVAGAKTMRDGTDNPDKALESAYQKFKQEYLKD